MKNLNVLICLLLLALLGCSSSSYDDQYVFIGGDAVAFTSTISDPNVAGMSTQWNSGDKVGIFMLKNATTMVLNKSRNIEHNADPSGTLTALGDKIVFSTNEVEKVDFVAYYPFQSELEHFVYDIDVRNQKVQSNILLLYAKAEEKINTDRSVNLDFIQKTTKLVFNIAPGSGFTDADLKGIKAELLGMNTLADFNLATGQINRQREVQPISALVSATGKMGEAIVIPNNNIVLDLKFTLANNVSFEWKSEILTLNEATKYAYNITIGTNSISVSQGSITDWTGITDAPIEGEGIPVVNIVYNVGDYYPDAANPVGIVFEVSNLGKNGKVFSLVEKQARWGDNSKDEFTDGVDLIRDADKGAEATQNLINTRKGAGNFAGDYVIFHWLYNDLNNQDAAGRWYLPSKNELKSLYAALCGFTYDQIATTWTDGNSMLEYNLPASATSRATFNTKITDAGGTAFNFFGQYWAVTEISPNAVWSVHFQTSVLQNAKSKGDAFGRGRAILTF